jgi:hypothetical protein
MSQSPSSSASITVRLGPTFIWRSDQSGGLAAWINAGSLLIKIKVIDFGSSGFLNLPEFLSLLDAE